VARRGADRSSYPYRPDYLTMNRRVALAGIGATVAGRAWRLAFGSSVAAPRELQEIDLEQILRLTSVPSLAVATVDGERLAARAVGVLQRGGTARATADTPYAAASLTKGVVAYAALALVHDGALVLDRPVHEYLSLPNADDVRATRITARHLLSHSGGWRNWRFGPTPPLVADFEPGSRWSYSGEGFFFLQRVLERITGQGIGTIVRERVLTPLGMARSAMLAPATADPSAAIGHDGRGMPIADGPAVRQARPAVAAMPIDDARRRRTRLRDASPETTPIPVSPTPPRR
jgi:CubicO group peptidase (beta-lactamase class C family)